MTEATANIVPFVERADFIACFEGYVILSMSDRKVNRQGGQMAPLNKAILIDDWRE